VENQRYLFKFYFKKEKKIRVDFSQPHSGLTIFYHDEDKEVTVRPLRLLSSLKFRLSVDNPLMKTLTGQRINQTDMGYFINFMFKNLKSVEQGENEFREDDERVEFLFWALDYIEEKSPEKYRISISKKDWLPIHIERYNLGDRRLEVTDIRNYVLNAHLQDKFFLP
jgi:outer membrane lipoprotein-sorting protein